MFSITVIKNIRVLLLRENGRIIARFPVALGFSPTGHKEREGDGKTPEGDYTVCQRNESSKFYRSLGLSYPNRRDAERGLFNGWITKAEYEAILSCYEKGLKPPWNTALGGAICIHGNGIATDWTAGCIALENDKMALLWNLCPIGTPVRILP